MAEKIRLGRSKEESRCHCAAIRKASRRISQLYDAALAPSGLKTTQRAILAQIRRSQPAPVGGSSGDREFREFRGYHMHLG